MTQEKMDRISELTRIARERELTPDEQAERKALREEYIADWRRSTIDVLENTYIDHGDGRSIVRPCARRSHPSAAEAISISDEHTGVGTPSAAPSDSSRPRPCGTSSVI